MAFDVIEFPCAFATQSERLPTNKTEWRQGGAMMDYRAACARSNVPGLPGHAHIIQGAIIE
jgi:hypothetical protein